MDTPITHLTSINIKGLWNEIDVNWELDPKVNILVGRNGSGKTTLLNLIAFIIGMRGFSFSGSEISLFSFMRLDFNDDYFLSIKTITKESIRKTPEGNSKLQKEPYSKMPEVWVESVDSSVYTFSSLISLINFSKISTFELSLKDLEQAQNEYTPNNVKTELDLLLAKLVNDFKSYQLTLRNLEKQATQALDEKIAELTSKQSASQTELEALRQALADKNQKIADINQQKQTFIQKVNFLFADSGKAMDFDENNAIVFKKADKTIQAYQLSSGEKQLLIILLTIVLQQNKPYIVLMDEPELSLHLAWQLDLIEIIQTLNPNCQLIIATHAPGIFSRGWNDKVTEIEDIIKTS